MKSGYWQVPLYPGDKEKTAFAVPGGGLWQFTVMPFGLTNAVATFQRYMERVLRPLLGKGVFVYVDDIIVMGDSVINLIDRLKEVFRMLDKFNLRVNGKKCSWFRKEMKFLGHIVSFDGVRVDQEKVAAVKDWPRPNCANALRSFLGLATYYRRFVKGFADIARPLHQLTRQGTRFIWGERAELSFLKLKEVLSDTPVLEHPVAGQEFWLDVDASGSGIGAVLSQQVDGAEKVVEFYSRSLSEAERNYCITRLELLGLVSAVKHLHHYLCGVRVKVRTDHSSLTWLKSFRRVEGQLARWMEVLALYDLEIVHRPGRIHSNADALSRKLCGKGCQFCQERRKVGEVAAMRVSVEAVDWKKEQHSDSDINIVKTWLVTGFRPQWEQVSGGSNLLRALWSQFESLVVEENLLKRKVTVDEMEVKQIVVPGNLTDQVIDLFHGERNHLGVTRVWTQIKQQFYWPGWRNQTLRRIHSCLTCLKVNGPHSRSKQPYKSYLVGSPWQRLAMDFFGPLPVTARGEKFVLVIMDYFTKWVECYPVGNTEAVTVANVLMQEVIPRYGIPTEIHTDQGRAFESVLLKQLFERLGINKTRTMPYRPQSDGMAENFMRTLKGHMIRLLEGHQRNWPETIPWLLMHFRSSPQTTTGISPAKAFLGREIVVPRDLILGTPEVHRSGLLDYVVRQERGLERVHHVVRHRIQNVHKSGRYEGRVPRVMKLSPGEQVLVFDPSRRKGISTKLFGRWKGPGVILAKINDWVYKIRFRGRVIVRHRDHLCPVITK